MFDRERVREALCILAIISLEHDGIPPTPITVFGRIVALSFRHSNPHFPHIDLTSIITLDAEILDARNIASTLRRLLTELEDPHTLIV